MNNIITGQQAVTMTSLELVDFINQHRKSTAELIGKTFPSPGYAELAHADFLKKVPEVLGEGVGNFSETYRHQQNGQIYPMYRFPKREACLMAMSYSYELQAAVFDRMTTLEQGLTGHRPMTAVEILHAQSGLLVEMEHRQAALAQATARVEQRVEELVEYQLMTKRPSNAEAITHIRRRIFQEYGLPEHVVDQVMRQLPYSPKPAGMVKNTREEAEGASYAVYWTKDVNAVFRRFVGECTRVTLAFVTHPFIEARFRLTPGVEVRP